MWCLLSFVTRGFKLTYLSSASIRIRNAWRAIRMPSHTLVSSEAYDHRQNFDIDRQTGPERRLCGAHEVIELHPATIGASLSEHKSL